MKQHKMSLLCTLALLTGLLAGAVRAGDPTERIRQATDKVIAIASDPALKGPAKLAERRQKMRAEISDRFDWSALARGTLGEFWAKASEAEQQEFTGLFRTLLERTYMKKIEGYAGEKVEYTGETVEGATATVSTQIVTTQQTRVPLTYKMQQKDGAWLVADVFIENVSLLENYRAQFTEQLQQGGTFAALNKQLKAKTSTKEK